MEIVTFDLSINLQLNYKEFYNFWIQKVTMITAVSEYGHGGCHNFHYSYSLAYFLPCSGKMAFVCVYVCMCVCERERIQISYIFQMK